MPEKPEVKISEEEAQLYDRQVSRSEEYRFFEIDFNVADFIPWFFFPGFLSQSTNLFFPVYFIATFYYFLQFLFHVPSSLNFPLFHFAHRECFLYIIGTRQITESHIYTQKKEAELKIKFCRFLNLVPNCDNAGKTRGQNQWGRSSALWSTGQQIRGVQILRNRF